MKPRIRIRIGNAYNGDDSATGQFHNATFAEALKALLGVHKPPETEADSPGYHSSTLVLVVATYPADTDEQVGRKTVSHREGEPIFGQEVTVYGRETAWGQPEPRDAQISMGSIGTHDTATAQLRLSLLTLAISLAEAANAEPACPVCAAYAERRAARKAARN